MGKNDVSIKDQVKFKLLGTSDMKLAKHIGESVGLWTITHGDTRARVERERHGEKVIVLVDYKGEMYELEPLSATTV